MGRYVVCLGMSCAGACLIPCVVLVVCDAAALFFAGCSGVCLWDCNSLGSCLMHLLRLSDMEVSVRGVLGCGLVLVSGCLAFCGCLVLCRVLVLLVLFAGGVYALRLTFSEQYPEKPPRVRFTCQMFHPNGTLFVALCVCGLCYVLYKTWGLSCSRYFGAFPGLWS